MQAESIDEAVQYIDLIVRREGSGILYVFAHAEKHDAVETLVREKTAISQVVDLSCELDLNVKYPAEALVREKILCTASPTLFSGLPALYNKLGAGKTEKMTYRGPVPYGVDAFWGLLNFKRELLHDRIPCKIAFLCTGEEPLATLCPDLKEWASGNCDLSGLKFL
jgi:hypothetical protein